MAIFGDFSGDDLLRIHGISSNIERGFSFYIANTMPERPVLLISIYLNYLLFGLNPISYKIVSILLHGLCGVLLYYLIKPILNKNKLNTAIGFCSALLFICAPLNSQVIVVVIQRGVILSTLFGLLFTLSLSKYFQNSKSRYVFYSSIFMLLGMLSKPNTFIFIPIVIVYLNYLYPKKLKRILRVSVPNLVYLVFPIYMLLIAQRDTDALENYSSIKYFAYQISNFFIYLKFLFVPFDLRFYHYYDVENIYTHFKTWLSLVGHSLIFFYAWLSYKKKNISYIIIIFIYLSLAPESSFFPIKHAFFEHRFYLTSFFVFTLLCYFIFRIKNVKVTGFIVSLVCIFFTISGNFHLNNVSTRLKFEFNNFNYNYTRLDNVSNIFSIAYAQRKVDILKTIDQKMDLPDKYSDIEFIYRGLINFEKYSDKRKLQVINQTLEFLKIRTLEPMESSFYFGVILHNLINYVLFSKMHYFYIDKVEYFLKLEEALEPVYKKIVHYAYHYTYLSLPHIEFLKRMKVFFQEKDLNNRYSETIVKVNRQLNCYGIIFQNKLFTINKTEFNKRFGSHCSL